MLKPQHAPCPTLDLARAVTIEARQLNADLRRLRQAMKTCDRCTDPCPQIMEFHEATDAAIREIGHQWGL